MPPYIEPEDGTYRAGGWHYSFNQTASDGSTIGWVILSFLDAAAAGAIVPAWVPARFNGSPTSTGALTGHINTNGTIDYTADGNAASNHAVGPQKNGIGLQGRYWVGETSGPRVNAFTANLNSWWPGASPYGIGGSYWGGPGNHGSGCAMIRYQPVLIVGIPVILRPRADERPRTRGAIHIRQRRDALQLQALDLRAERWHGEQERGDRDDRGEVGERPAGLNCGGAEHQPDIIDGGPLTSRPAARPRADS